MLASRWGFEMATLIKNIIKNIMKRIILILSIMLLSQASTWAYDFRVDGIYYNILSEEDLTCEVTYLSTSNSNYSAYQGSVVIPSTVNFENATYKVTSIGSSTFSGCTRLTEIAIPNSVTEIGSSAFYGCSGLTSVTIPNSVTKIGNSAFEYCNGLTSVTIPNSVTTINGSAFYNCTGLTSVIIGESVTSIGYNVFYNCTRLTEIVIPNSVTSIGDHAFYNCYGLTEIVIPNSVTSIGEKAFYKCSGLTSLTIGNSVTKIDNNAFYNCSGLIEVNFNAKTCASAGSSILYGAFYGCSNISIFNFGDNVTIIPSYLCYKLRELTSVTIPESVTKIGDQAFYYCSGMKSITSLNLEPPSCGSNVFYDVSSKNCVLYVPYGSIGAYATTSPWSSFYNIIEIEVDAIADITTNGNAKATGYYTTDGKQVPTLQRGINIIRYSDGTAKKISVK